MKGEGKIKVHAFNTGVNFKRGRGFLAADMRIFAVIVDILLSPLSYGRGGKKKMGGVRDISFQSSE